MIRALLKPVSTVALLAAAGFIAGGMPSAMAADLGGDCCADLEERVAELEASTVRKGNRKVSLEVSGHVHEGILAFDDGEEENIYVVNNDSARSRFRFKGKAKITGDWEAGYLLEIGVRSARSDRVDAGPDDFFGTVAPVGDDPGGALDIRHSSWFISSKTYGALWVGETENATEKITEINLSQTADVANLSDWEDYFAGFRLRGSENGIQSNRRLGELFADSDGDAPGEGDRGNYVRYVTPTFSGFTASAAWGEDDEWSVALRYAGEFNSIKLAAGIGYTENTEGQNGSGVEQDCPVTSNVNPNLEKDADCHSVGGSISAIHEPTGIFVSFGAGYQKDENVDDFFIGTNSDADDRSEFYSAQAGIERKWLPLGKTTLYGEYFNYDGGSIGRGTTVNDAVNRQIIGSDIEAFGVGIVQGIDAAAMRVYVSYRHFDVDVELDAAGAGSATTDEDIEDLDVIQAGAIIKF